MTTVKCPICKDRVSGATTADLNENLKEHLANVHQMSNLMVGSRGAMPQGSYTGVRYGSERPMERELVREESMEPREGRMERRGYASRGYPYIEKGPSTEMFSAPETRREREVETWSSRNPERFRSENYIPREEVRQWRYPVTGPAGERGPATSVRYREDLIGGEGRVESREVEERRGVMRREYDMPATINCPLCGNLVRGRDEDDLSDELRDHMSDVHDIRPKMAARYRS